MRKTFTLLTSAAAILFSISVSGQNKIPAEEASKHYGETITICSTILEDNLIFDSKTKNTLLLLGGVRNQKVTVVVPAETSKKVIDKPKSYYSNKNVCVTGKVVELNGKPEMVVNAEDDIQFGSSGGGSELKPNDFMRFE